MPNENRLTQPGEVVVKEIVLITHAGLKFDLYPQMVEFNIYEGLFTDHVSGNIILVDTINLIGFLPLVGHERIYITFITPGREKEITIEADTFDVTNKTVLADSKQFYTIHFIAPEFRFDKQHVVSKYYKGTVDKIISTIFTEEIKANIKTSYDKNHNLTIGDKCIYEHQIIVPYLSPLSAIAWLAAKGIRSTPVRPPLSGHGHTSNFIFFQSLDGFVFTSLDKLYTQSPFIKYGFYTGNTNNRNEAGVKDVERDFYRMESYHTKGETSILDNTTSGMYASRLVTHDMTTKTWKVHEFDYLQDHFRTNHVDVSPLVRNYPDPNGYKIHEAFGSTSDFRTKHTGLFNGYNNNTIEIYLQQRRSQLRQLHHTGMEIAVPGDSDRRVGEIVELSIPSVQQQVVAGQDDPMLSGKYIIASIRHCVTKARYILRMQVLKDGYASYIPDVSKFGPTQ